MRVLDLFSGIGGFSLGLRMAGGFDTVQFVEQDGWCQQVLAKNFPGVPIHGDIRTFTGTAGSADLVCGGFPCQPFSHAGKRGGEADDRYLWPEMARVVSAVRPAWVLGENVNGLAYMGLEQVLSDLEGMGYQSQVLCIPACGIGAPQRRERLWILSHTLRGIEEVVGEVRRSWGEPEYLPWDSLGERKGEPTMVGVAPGIPRRMDRLRGLGNAVVPQVVAEIGRAIRMAA